MLISKSAKRVIFSRPGSGMCNTVSFMDNIKGDIIHACPISTKSMSESFLNVGITDWEEIPNQDFNYWTIFD